MPTLNHSYKKPKDKDSLSSTQNVPMENPTPVREYYHAEVGKTILTIIQEKSGRSRTSAKQLMGSGRVSLNGKITTRANEVLDKGDVVTVHVGVRAKDFQHPLLEKVYEDEDLLLIYKKAGISTVNTSHKDRTETAIWILSRSGKDTVDASYKLFMLNRLDKNSEGYVLFAKNIQTKELMTKGWGNLVKQQCFLLCLEGELRDNTGTFTYESKDKEGKVMKRTSAEYRVLKRGAKGGLLIVELMVRGSRLFNLRKLIKENGLSIFGDVRSKSDYKTDNNIALIQTKFVFVHPVLKELLTYERKFPSHIFDYLKADQGPTAGLALTRINGGTGVSRKREKEDKKVSTPRVRQSKGTKK